MPDMRTTVLSEDDIVAIHVAVLILRDKADETCIDAQGYRLRKYAQSLDDLITNSTMTDGCKR